MPNNGRLTVDAKSLAPFLNFFKKSQTIGYDPVDSTFTPAPNTNEQGFPTALPGGGVGAGGSSLKGQIIGLPIIAEYSGNWVLAWTGYARISLTTWGGTFNIVSNTNATIHSSSGEIDAEGTNVRIVFNRTGTSTDRQLRWDIKEVGGTELTDILLCREADESRWSAGEYFDDRFIALLQTFRPFSIRHLNALGGNEAPACRKDAERITTDHMVYYSGQYSPNHWAGTTTKSGAIYTAAGYSGQTALIDKDYVHIYIDTAADQSPMSLNVAGLGAKQIFRPHGDQPAAIGEMTVGNLTLWYDEVIDAWIIADYNGTREQWPTEVACDLSNRVDCHMWFTVPYNMNLAEVTAMTQRVKANLNTDLDYINEYSNEIWNSSFTQYQYAEYRGDLEISASGGIPMSNYSGSGRPRYVFISRRLKEIKDIVAAEFGAQTNWKTSCCMQWTSIGGAAYSPGTAALNDGGSPNDGGIQVYNLLKDVGNHYSDVGETKPWEEWDYIGGATYISGTYFRESYANNAGDLSAGWADVQAALDNFDAGTTLSKRQAFTTIARDIADRITNTFRERDTGWDNVAQDLGLQVSHYEGAFSATWPASITELENRFGVTNGVATTYYPLFENAMLAYRESPQCRREQFGFWAVELEGADTLAGSTYSWQDEYKAENPWGIISEDFGTYFNAPGRAALIINNRLQTDRVRTA